MISVFQLLKNGITGKKVKVEPKVRRKSSDHIKFEEFQLQKFNPEDSESEQLPQIDFKRRRKESLDIIEKELTKRELQKQEKKNHLLKILKIKVQGDNLPPLITNFSKMMKVIDRQLIINIKKQGYLKPTPIQMAAIPIILAGRSLIAMAPTGSGKTAAFTIPILQTLDNHKEGGPRCLIISPTMELGDQLLKEVHTFEIKEKKLHIKSIQHMNRDKQAFKQSWLHLDLLITTPLKFLKKHKFVDLSTVQTLIMDEADKYFELGLASQVQMIVKAFEAQNIQYLFFSATLPEPIEEFFFKEIMFDPIKVQIGGRNHVLKSIDQELKYCTNEYGKFYEIKNIINEGRLSPPVLIFVQSKQRAESLLIEFVNLQSQIRVDCIHGCKTTQEREQIIKDFEKGDIWVLICTDLVARGIDFKGVQLVINYDFPQSMITYVHRVGRTGRAGNSGKAITFFTDEDKPSLKSLANILKVSGCDVPEWILGLRKIDKKDRKRLERYPVKREEIN
ncbi:hypothetical protein pb186bvf_007563 [Paramecium bursaria]